MLLTTESVNMLNKGNHDQSSQTRQSSATSIAGGEKLKRPRILVTWGAVEK